MGLTTREVPGTSVQNTRAWTTFPVKKRWGSIAWCDGVQQGHQAHGRPGGPNLISLRPLVPTPFSSSLPTRHGTTGGGPSQRGPSPRIQQQDERAKSCFTVRIRGQEAHKTPHAERLVSTLYHVPDAPNRRAPDGSFQETDGNAFSSRSDRSDRKRAGQKRAAALAGRSETADGLWAATRLW